ncbi:MAG: (Fe-S)-binding protein [Anaerolineae bacterium]|nr:(Fe-S)-binding protein [Anaerolineae bacterium]
MKDTIATLENCRFCLMCRHVAPVGMVTNQEALTPHGMALLVTSQQRGLADWNEETVGIIFSEVDGGNSRMHCATDQPFEEALAAVRADLVDQGLVSTAVTQLRAHLQQWQNPYQPQLPQPATGAGQVALFAGDEAAYLWPETLPAVLQLLGAVGMEVVVVGYGRNNGLFAHSAGFPDLAAQLWQTTFDELESVGAKQLLVLSAGDFYAFNDRRGGFSRPVSASAKASPPDFIEVTDFLAERLTAGEVAFRKLEDETPWAYVDPTHAVRVPNRHEKVRELVTAVMPTPPRELFWRKDRAQPVGSTYIQFSNPALAERLTRARLQDAQTSGAQLLLCEDPATLHHLNRYAGEYGLRVLGLYELLAASVSSEQ